MIILGIILLIIGFVAKIAILWTIGIIVIVVGAILALLGMAGHAVGGRQALLLTAAPGATVTALGYCGQAPVSALRGSPQTGVLFILNAGGPYWI